MYVCRCVSIYIVSKGFSVSLIHLRDRVRIHIWIRTYKNTLIQCCWYTYRSVWYIWTHGSWYTDRSLWYSERQTRCVTQSRCVKDMWKTHEMCDTVKIMRQRLWDTCFSRTILTLSHTRLFHASSRLIFTRLLSLSHMTCLLSLSHMTSSLLIYIGVLLRCLWHMT